MKMFNQLFRETERPIAQRYVIICRCGKKMIVREHLVGRKVECPQCKMIFKAKRNMLKPFSGITFNGIEKKRGYTYEVYTAPTKQIALGFLQGVQVTKGLYYVIIETPTINIGKDKYLTFDEKTGMKLDENTGEKVELGRELPFWRAFHTADNERVAEELCKILRNTQGEEQERVVKLVGNCLNAYGGFERMVTVCDRVRELGDDARWIERLWDGIGRWRG